MTEQDREYLETIRGQLRCDRISPGTVQWVNSEVWKLLAIIDRLDKQLAGLLEAGEPFGKLILKLSWDGGAVSDETEFCLLRSPVADFTAGQIRRLAKAMKEVKDDKH